MCFLAVQNSSIGDLVTESVTQSLRTLLVDIQKLITLRPFRHLIRVMRRHVLTFTDKDTNNSHLLRTDR